MDVVYWISWAWLLDSALRGYTLLLLPLYALLYTLVHRHWHPKIPWWIGVGFIILSLAYPRLDYRNRGYVEQATSNYVLLRYNQSRYYLKQPDVFLEMGDQFVCLDEPVIQPLSITTVEGGFDFSSYLHKRNVFYTLQCDIDVVNPTWFRLHHWKTSWLQRWPTSIQPLIGHLMFQDDYSQDPVGILTFFSISGLGWWTVLWFVDRALKPWLRIRHHKIILTILILPYSLLMLSSFSIVRVSWFYLLSLWSPPRIQRWGKRWGILLYFVVFPFSYGQQGFQLYVLFKVYYSWIHPWLKKVNIPIRIVLYTCFLYGIQALFFNEVSLLQPILYPLWIGVFPPLWIWIFLASWFPSFQNGILQVLHFLRPLLLNVSTQLPVYYVVPLTVGMGGIIVIAILLLLYGLKRSLSTLTYPAALISLSLMLLSQLPIQRWVYPFRVHFINVGQGDATLLEIGTYRILIDTGGSLYRDLALDVLKPYFSRLSIHRLQHVIITHDDLDHGGALDSLSQRIRIDTIHRFSFSSLSTSSWRLVNLNLWQDEAKEDNDASLILLFEYEACSVLIMGDAPVYYEEKLIGLSKIKNLDILRIGHHGSITSTSETFLDWTQPHVAIISVGGGNRYGHPHPTIVQRLDNRNILTYRTDIHGTIQMNSCKIKA